MTGTFDFWDRLQSATTELGINIDQMGQCRFVKIRDITPTDEDAALFIFRIKELSDRLAREIEAGSLPAQESEVGK